MEKIMKRDLTEGGCKDASWLELANVSNGNL
jgi:hypothetical protein